MRLRFDYNGREKTLDTVTTSKIDDVLKKLNSNTNSYVVLESGNNYIQCAGSSDSLTLEIRIHNLDDSFKHYVLGRKDISKIWHIIKCRVGPIRALAHENLNIEDAKNVFNYFYEYNEISPGYNKRNATKYYMKKN